MVSVNSPATVLVSAASPLLAIETVAVSLSRILMLSLAVPIVMPGSAVMPVSVMVTDSAPSTRESGVITGTVILALVEPPGMVTDPLSAV